MIISITIHLSHNTEKTSKIVTNHDFFFYKRVLDTNCTLYLIRDTVLKSIYL